VSMLGSSVRVCVVISENVCTEKIQRETEIQSLSLSLSLCICVLVRVKDCLCIIERKMSVRV
jgi:hypothetical protein